MITTSQIIQIVIGFITISCAMWLINQIPDLDEMVKEQATRFKKWRYNKAILGIVGIIFLYFTVSQIAGIIACMTNPYCNGSIHIAQSNATISILNGVKIP